MRTYSKYYNLSKYENITVGRDEQFYLIRYFKGISPPYMVLYDRNQYQKFSFEGDTPIEKIISAVNHLL